MTDEGYACVYCDRRFPTARGRDVHEARWCPWAGCPICYGGLGEACWSHFL